MHKMITRFETYDKILRSSRLARDLRQAIDYIIKTDITPYQEKNQKDLIVLPVSICSVPITILNKLTYTRIAEYDHNIKVITLCYNFYTAHSPTDLFDTLVHEYGHAYLFNNNIDKKTAKNYFDQHEFFSQMLSFLYGCRVFSAKRNSLYLWCRCKTINEQKRIGLLNDFPTNYYKKYWYKHMVQLFKKFVKTYPPSKEFIKMVKTYG